MTRTMEIPERICRRVEKRIGRLGYTLPKLTVKLYTIWLDGKIELDDEKRAARMLSSKYTGIFGIVKDKIDSSAPHDMESVRARLEAFWLDGAVLDVCDLVVSEAYFALQHSYRLSKEDALDALMKLAVHPGFRLSRQAVASLRTPPLERHENVRHAALLFCALER